MCICHDIDKSDIAIKTVVMKKICKYHKKNGQEFHIKEIVPRGLCFEAFSVAYPSALALLYNGNMAAKGCSLWKQSREDVSGKGVVTVRCPSGQNSVVFQLTRREKLSWIVTKIKHGAEAVFGAFFFPVDRVHKEHDVELKVVEVQGLCPHGHKVGDEYFLNTQDTDVLCPASFNSLYTFIQLLYKGVKVPWANEQESAFIHCPDHEGIIYKVQKSTGENKGEVHA